jgi:orotate phosphoribosyltransferase
MEEYKKRFAAALAENEALFFDDNLVLKDGRPTPYFVNMAMFRTGRLSLEMGSFFADMMVEKALAHETDIVLGPSYKGSAIALATTIALWEEHRRDLLFEYDRKEAKTHGEASASKSLFVNGTFFDGCRIFVVDDVATSMATKLDLLEKIDAESRRRNMTFQVLGIGIGVDREQTTAVYDSKGGVALDTKGTDAIQDFVKKSGVTVYAVAGIREVVDYIHQEKIPVRIAGTRRPMDDHTKARFDQYMKTYGVDASLRKSGGK